MKLKLTHHCDDTGPMVLDKVEPRGVVWGRQSQAPEHVRFRVSKEDVAKLSVGMSCQIVAGVLTVEPPKPKQVATQYTHSVKAPKAKRRPKKRASKRGE